MNHFIFLVNALASWMDALVRASWQGGLVIALLWLVCRLWPGLPSTPRCWLWRLAYAKLLLGLVCLPPLALPLLGSVTFHPPSAPPTAQAIAPIGASFPPGPVDAPPAATTPNPYAVVRPAPPTPIFLQPPLPRPTLPTVQTWLLAAWLLGVFVSLSQVAAAWRRARVLYAASAPLADEALHTDPAELCRRLGLGRVPPLRVADGLASPLLLGLTRPAVLLPAFVLTDHPRPELRLMMAHEMAHLARRDLLWNGLPLTAQCLFFFHPLVWLAGQEWGLVQEIACDALTVKVTGTSPAAYGRMLLGIATRRRASAAFLFPTLAVAAPRHTLRRRLFAMQHIGTASRPRVILAAALTLALAVGGLLPWHVVAQAGPSPSIPSAATQEDAAWEKQNQKQQADIASKNAQLDAQLAEIQKHLPPAQSKKVQSWVASINAEYAKWQQRVQVSEQSRAAYIASHPNRLSDTRIAFVQKVNWDQMHHRPISESVRAEYAAISQDQRDRVALLRSYSFEVLGVRMMALIQKEAAVSVLQQRLAGKLPARQQNRGTATKASIASPQASTASPRTLTVGGLLPLHVAAPAGPSPSTPPSATQGDEAWQKQEQKQQAELASRNACLDAQIAEVQKHLSVTPLEKAGALAYIRWIDADYAANQMAVQLSEQQRADYAAAHPNSLTNTQIAFVQKVSLSKLSHSRISESIRAKLAAIPKDQRDRVATLRYYDLNITFARMRAYVQKQANVVQLRAEYSNSKQRLVGKLAVG